MSTTLQEGKQDFEFDNNTSFESLLIMDIVNKMGILPRKATVLAVFDNKEEILVNIFDGYEKTNIQFPKEYLFNKNWFNEHRAQKSYYTDFAV